MGTLRKLTAHEIKNAYGYAPSPIKGDYAICRYTPEIQSLLNCKVKAEPWMHIIFSTNYKYERDANRNHSNGVNFAIYVWDTREVLYIQPYSKTSMYGLADNVIQGVKSYDWNKLVMIAKPANDNHKSLKGKDVADIIYGLNRTVFD